MQRQLMPIQTLKIMIYNNSLINIYSSLRKTIFFLTWILGVGWGGGYLLPLYVAVNIEFHRYCWLVTSRVILVLFFLNDFPKQVLLIYMDYDVPCLWQPTECFIFDCFVCMNVFKAVIYSRKCAFSLHRGYTFFFTGSTPNSIISWQYVPFLKRFLMSHLSVE